MHTALYLFNITDLCSEVVRPTHRLKKKKKNLNIKSHTKRKQNRTYLRKKNANITKHFLCKLVKRKHTFHISENNISILKLL